MDFRKLTTKDSGALEHLIAITENNLWHEHHWLPITDASRDNFFNEDWTHFYGLWDGGKLVGAIALFYNENEFGESVEELGGLEGKIAEAGRLMVHPDYRGQGLGNKLMEELVKVADGQQLDYLVATVHPTNTPSLCVVRYAGFEQKLTFTKDNGYLRHVFVYEMCKKLHPMYLV